MRRGDERRGVSNLLDYCFATTTAAADTGELEVWRDLEIWRCGIETAITSKPVDVLEALFNASVEMKFLHAVVRLVCFLCVSLFHEI